MNINPSFVDVDLTSNSDHGLFGGALPPEEQLLASAAEEFEDKFDLLERDEWDALIEAQAQADLIDSFIRNQGSEGSCVGNATTAAFDRLQMLDNGRIYRTSAMSLYKQIGRSAQSGAYLGDALQTMLEVGCLPVDSEENRKLFKHVHPATGFNVRLAGGFETTAQLFRIKEYWKLNSFQGMATAILKHGLGVIYARDGHCLCGWMIVKDEGSYYCKYKNSWWVNGQPWGDGGYGYDSERKLSGTWQGWFAIRSIGVIRPNMV